MGEDELRAIENWANAPENKTGLASGLARDLTREVRRLKGDVENSRETLAAGERAYVALEERHSAVCARYEAEVQRLKGLIKRVKTVDNDFGTKFCPWCGYGDPQHDDACPAFTPNGDVR